jgi:hypothetical protein
MKIEVFIFNYGKFFEAVKLHDTFDKLGYKTYLLNCESPTDPPFGATETILKLPNIYYSGQWNETLKLAKGDVIFIINSDVIIPKPAAVMYRMKQFYKYYKEKAGIYAPNHYWTPWTYNPYMLETLAFGLKRVPATDSTLWSVSREVANSVGEIDTKVNSFGWGIEIVAAYKCFKEDKFVVRDYHVKCDHPRSTAYNRDEAGYQWRNWVTQLKLGNDFWEYHDTRDKYQFGWEGHYHPKFDDIVKIL